MPEAKVLQNVHLGDVIDIRDGTHDTPKYVEHGIPLITSKNLTDSGLSFREINFISEDDHNGISKRLAVDKGDILYGMIGTIGKPTLVETDRVFSIKNMALFKQSNPKIYNRYLLWLLNSSAINKQIAQASKGGTQKFVSLGALRSLKATFPSFSEQRRIAAILDQTDALRVLRREALAQLDSLTQSIFIEMFGNPVTNPKGWPIKKLSDLIADGDSINYGVVQPGDDVETGVGLIRVGDLINGRVCHDSLKRITPSIESAYKRSRLFGDEILVSCVGSVGVVALADESVKGFNIARAVARIRLSNDANREFIAAHLTTDSVKRYFIQELRTVSQPTLNIKQLSETEVMYPPIALQSKFAARLVIFREIKSAHQNFIFELDNLFASLQHRAFRGEL